MTDPPNRRKPRQWPPYERPVLLPATGFRDQVNRITYLPWADASAGLLGWELIPDRSYRLRNGLLPVLVYIIPTIEAGSFEIRCHVTNEDPDPESDQLLGKITIPAELLGEADEES